MFGNADEFATVLTLEGEICVGAPVDDLFGFDSDDGVSVGLNGPLIIVLVGVGAGGEATERAALTLGHRFEHFYPKLGDGNFCAVRQFRRRWVKSGSCSVPATGAKHVLDVSKTEFAEVRGTDWIKVGALRDDTAFTALQFASYLSGVFEEFVVTHLLEIVGIGPRHRRVFRSAPL